MSSWNRDSPEALAFSQRVRIADNEYIIRQQEQRLDRLQAENERLRVALREIADGKYEHYLASNPSQNAATVFSRAALENNDD